MRENTRLVWTESPGSVTMEVQDVPAIAAAAHARGALVVLDNTWSAGVLLRCVRARRRRDDAGAHEVRRRAQRLAAGHDHRSRRRALPPARRRAQVVGLRRLARRMQPRAARFADAGRPARRASRRRRSRSRAGSPARPEVERVLHPALPSCPGHEFWMRDFTGSSGVFSVVLAPGPSREQVFAFVDALRLFEVGYSWAGTTSLAVAYTIAPRFQPAALRPSPRAIQHRPRVDERSHRRSGGRAAGAARELKKES